MKSIYFISDAHLGCKAVEHRRTQERRIVRFLDTIKDKAEAIYMLGDMFDFWFEYSEVVPKGFTRFLGKISELTDSGIEVHYFTGNHDMWMGDYLNRECGVIIHHEPCTIELYNKVFYIAHGHIIQTKNAPILERLMMWCFQNRFLQFMARLLPSGPFIRFGYSWARHSHIHHHINGDPEYLGDDKEQLVLFANEYLASHPNINYFVFGHRHIDLNKEISTDASVVILGQWYSLFTYAVFNGSDIITNHYIEGETKID